MIVYDRHNPFHVTAVMVVLFTSLLAIGYLALVLKDNRGRFRMTTFLALMTALALFIVAIRLLLLIPV
jgi:predicted PP-loop superfamily ATPase